MVTRGRFISFEGGEGCGKSTQVKRLSAALTKQGIDHIVTREPGGTALAEKIRPLLVENQHIKKAEGSQQADPVMSKQSGAYRESSRTSGGNPIYEDWHPLAETLLFLAARVQHVKMKIEPALASGKWVICDRFTDSTLTYQGIGKGLEVEYLWNLQQSLLGDFAPDQTFLLDIDPSIGLKRAASRQEGEDRFEQLDLSFHQALRQGFLTLAKKHKTRCHVIDATKSIEEIAVMILEESLKQS